MNLCIKCHTNSIHWKMKQHALCRDLERVKSKPVIIEISVQINTEYTLEHFCQLLYSCSLVELSGLIMHDVFFHFG